MIYSIDAKFDQFVLLASNPYSWQVLISKSVGLQVGDRIKYIEVNNSMVPTGAELIGVIRWIGSGDIEMNNGSSTFAYCYNISQGVGLARVGSSLIVL